MLLLSHVYKNHDFVITWLYNKVETCKDFRFYYFWLYFAYRNFQNGYFLISLCTITIVQTYTG